MAGSSFGASRPELFIARKFAIGEGDMVYSFVVPLLVVRRDSGTSPMPNEVCSHAYDALPGASDARRYRPTLCVTQAPPMPGPTNQTCVE